MKIFISFSILWLLLTSACYRPETRNIVITLPEVNGNTEELDAVKRVLLSEQDRLRKGLTFYQDIRINAEHSSLEVTYNREYLADMNLVHKINQLGYQINGLPGDPEKRAAFLKQMNLP
ncbi:hypothetical protein P0Y35_12680 [Kiritimatiellaeota bacterium B1221]|nr:hypothetical protein [Kiritimatiellaeota bacterium B1221]